MFEACFYYNQGLIMSRYIEDKYRCLGSCNKMKIV